MNSNSPTSHVQSLIQNIMRKFQSVPTPGAATSPIPVNPRPLLSTPANYSVPPANKPKIAATFLHFYSGSNSQISTPTEPTINESPAHPNAELWNQIEPVETQNSAFNSTPKYSCQLNVPASVPNNPFKRPLPIMADQIVNQPCQTEEM
jgi:hypothetical protein